MHSRRARHRSVIGPALLLVIVAIVAVGCSGIGQASLDPGAPCGGRDEERAPGFHADLEALVPETLDGAAPVQRDSGRYCSERSLGVLADAGHESLDFAGATWPGTDESGLAIVAYRAPGLTLDQLADAFARGADDARSVNQVHAQPTEVAGRPDDHRLWRPAHDRIDAHGRPSGDLGRLCMDLVDRARVVGTAGEGVGELVERQARRPIGDDGEAG
ncbi:MAG: hypothetical protein ACHQ02_05200, partial [Candidatus Limnocylindrales bacterium]